MPATDILPSVKMALRIMHDMLDSDILENIGAAIEEMVRRGVPREIAEDSSNQDVLSAIKIYCRREFWVNDAGRYSALANAWDVKTDEIRKGVSIE